LEVHQSIEEANEEDDWDFEEEEKKDEPQEALNFH
jgi:hypothetical protein